MERIEASTENAVTPLMPLNISKCWLDGYWGVDCSKVPTESPAAGYLVHCTRINSRPCISAYLTEPNEVGDGDGIEFFPVNRQQFRIAWRIARLRRVGGRFHPDFNSGEKD